MKIITFIVLVLTSTYSYAQTNSGVCIDDYSYALSAVPNYIAVADLNQDGKNDVITANTTNTISVVLSQNNKLLQQAKNYAAGNKVVHIATKDINNDGIVDLVACNYNSSNVSVFINDGKGAFDTARNYSLGLTPLAAVLEDVNGDNKIDIITANNNNKNISVLKGNGDGTFSAAESLVIGDYPCLALVSGDINADGKVDIIITATNAKVIVLSNTGVGGKTNLTVSGIYGVGTTPKSMACADINGDGIKDIITASTIDSTISVLQNQGNGSFVAAVSYATNSNPIALAVEDITGDGKADILTAHDKTNSVAVLQNKGNGTFAAAISYTVRKTPIGIAIADMDGDGSKDLLTANAGTKNIVVLKNTGNGTFSMPTELLTPAAPIAIALGDINGDGKADIVTAHGQAEVAGAKYVSIYINRGNKTFAAANNYPVPFKTGCVAMGDINGDGKIDMVTGLLDRDYSDTIAIYLGKGDATFNAPVIVSLDKRIGYDGRINTICLADFSNDGKLDIGIAIPGITNSVILVNNGNGSFPDTSKYSYSNQHGYYIASGDFNLDQRGDVIDVQLQNRTNVEIYFNPSKNKRSSVKLDVKQMVDGIAAGDMDGDAKDDIVFTTLASRQVALALNNGDSTVQPPINFSTGIIPNTIAVKDMDGDGSLDIVVASTSENRIRILYNSTPKVTITGASLVCSDKSIVLYASKIPNGYYAWNGANSNADSLIVTKGGAYSVSVSNLMGSCTATSPVKMVKGAQVKIGSSKINPCKGDTVILTANGADNYQWSTGVSTQSIKVMAQVNTSYSVVGTHHADACTDSKDSFLVSINTPSGNIIQQGNTLAASEAGLIYQWINCIDNTPIAGATQQSYTVTESGSYAVLLKNGDCTATSECKQIIYSAISNIDASTIQCYPNPVRDKLYLKNIKGIKEIQIVDVMGQQVQRILDFKTTDIDVNSLSNGIYFLRITSDAGIAVKMFQKIE